MEDFLHAGSLLESSSHGLDRDKLDLSIFSYVFQVGGIEGGHQWFDQVSDMGVELSVRL